MLFPGMLRCISVFTIGVLLLLLTIMKNKKVIYRILVTCLLFVLMSCASEPPARYYRASDGTIYRLNYAPAARSYSAGGYYATCSRCGGSGEIWYKVTNYQEKSAVERTLDEKLRSSSLGFLYRKHKKIGRPNSGVPYGYEKTGEYTRTDICSDCGGSGQVWISN